MRIALPCLDLPKIRNHFTVVSLAKFFLLFIFHSVFVNQIQAQHDLEIASISDVDSAGVGDEVTFTITLYNEGGTVLSGVMVKDLLPANMTYISSMPAIGTYTSSTGIWDLTSSFTDSVKLTLTARLDAPGVHYNIAEVYAMDGFDVDSEPNDGIVTDDDYTSSCVSIPFKICTTFNDTIVLTAPTGYDGYQWALDGVDIVDATSQIYKATQPGEYTFNADNILTNCSGGSCCPIEIENACFDLALDKKLASSQSPNVMPGDDVTYTITIHNQGDYYADSIEITDYIPAGMVNNTNQWVGNDTLLTIADGQLAPDGLAPNTTFSVDITLTVSSPTAVDSLLNYAEISSARDTSGTDSRDVDSAPDATNNDPGGASNSAADDYVDGDGTGTINDGVASTDEDDHDVEVIYICPTITMPTADFAICSGDAVGTLSVTTSTTDDIHFVYFTTAQTGNNMYSGGTSLGSVTPSSGTASITPSSFPSTPGTYFVYAIIDPAVDNGSCEPFEEIEITVNPLPTATAEELVLCDTDTDGFEPFTLTGADATVLNGQASGSHTVTYHVSQATADAGTGALASPYTNTTASSQIIYARVEVNGTGCYATSAVTLTVNPLPTATAEELVLCDTDTDGFEPFTLTGADATVLNGQASGSHTVTYHVSQATADAGTGALASPYTNTTASSQIIYARVEVTGTGCYATSAVTLTVNPLPTATAEELVLCDTDTDGFEPFTLTGADATVLNGQASGSHTVTYHVSQATADAGTGALASPYTNTTASSQIIYARVEVNGTGCYATSAVTLTVNPLPTATAEELVLCDTDTDGFEPFTLTGADATVLNGQASGSHTVTYHVSQATADAGTGALASPYTNTTASSQIIYARVEVTGTGCYATSAVTLTVNPLPTATAEELVLCDTDTDGFEPFTLTGADATVLNGQASGSHTVTYHVSQATADAGTGALASPYTNTTASSQIIYARVEVTGTGCYATSAVTLTVNPLPTATAEELVLCDTDTDGFEPFTLTGADATVLNGQASGSHTVTYHVSQATADAGTGALASPYTNTTASSQIIYARVEVNGTGCYATSAVTLTVNPLPTATAEELVLCDTDTDGFEPFTLTGADATVLNGQASGSHTVTYHVSQATADAGTGALASPYTNTTASSQIIYARVEVTGTGCYATSAVTLTVNPLPTATAEELVLCDTDTDGFEPFTLTGADATVLNGQASGSHTVTYHVSQATADAGTGALASPYTNTTASSQIIYARVEVTGTGCYATSAVTLTVNPLPTATAEELVLCDTDTDGFEPFTLTGADATVLNGQASGSHTVTYHVSQATADAGTGALASPYTNTTASSQIIYARVEVNGTGCYATSAVTLTVNPLPTATAEELVLCDTDTDGFEPFTLTGADATVLNGQASGSHTVTYHVSQATADAGTGALASPYTNTTASSQIIYARVEVTGTGCYATSAVTLTVNPLPTATAEELVLCDTDTDGFEPFTLTGADATVLNGQASGSHTVTYHVSQATADAGTGALASPYTNTTASSQIIYARVEVNGTGCYATSAVTLTVNPLPTATAEELVLCDTDTDGFEPFTLTGADATVLNGQASGSHTVTYHVSQATADAGTGALASPYTNTTASSQIIYARVEVNGTGCYATSAVTLTVNPLPTATAEELVLCDTDTDGFEPFTLTGADATVLNGQASGSHTVTYHVSQATADAGTGALASPYTNTTASSQIIYARVEVTGTGCYATSAVTLTVNPLPTATAEELVLCDTDTDGFEPFTLTGADATVLNGQASGSHTVTYHVSQATADAGTGALASPYTNTTASSQIIYARVEVNGTGCYATSAVTLTVNPLPTATAEELVLCDTDTDGFEPFTLTGADATVLNGQASGSHTVTYHVSQATADAGTGALASPYTNTTASSQIIYARVEVTGTGCYATSAVTLTVNPLPTATAEELVLCDTDTDGFEPFTLTGADATVLNGQASGSHTVTYHVSQATADAGTGALASPYTNTTASSQIIYARVEVNGTGCYATSAVTLTVNPLPTATAEELVLCDTDTDGFEPFTLTGADATVLNGQASGSHTVTYHVSQATADAGTGALASPYTNTTASSQIIYARVEVTGTGCYATSAVTLTVNPLPTATAEELVLCDTDTDGFEPFTLTGADATVLNGQASGSHTVTYHVSQATADAGTGALASPYTNTTASSQIIYARVEVNGTGCYATSAVTLTVNPLPTATAEELVLCDTDTDGFEPFTLTGADATVLNGQASGSHTVTYHVSQATADAGTGALASPYTNTTASSQIIYARVEVNGTGCYATSAVTLTVNPLPTATAEELVLCDTDTDGFEPFTLTGADATVLNGQASGSHTVTYHVSQATADAGTGALASPYTNTTASSQIIYARVEVTGTGCYATSAVTLTVNPLPTATAEELVLCDTDTDGFEPFTLTGADATVLNGQASGSHTVTYHVSQATADAGTGALASPYTNTTASSQIIYARVEVNGTGCYATSAVTLTVNPLPTATAEELVLCDTDTDGFEPFTLTGADATVLNGQASGSHTVTYHVSQATADAGTGALASPYTNTTASSQIIYARVEVTGTGCYATSAVTLTVNPLPTATAEELVLCDTDTDGFEPFTLTGADATVLNGQASGSHTVTYHVSQATADAGTGALASPYTNTTASSQIIYARVEVTGTGCYATSAVTLTVNSLPLITPTVTDATICSGSSVSIMINNTEAGVSYQLRNDEDDSNAFSPMNGNGGTITFTINPVTDSVVYNVFASTGDGCMIELTDKAVINVPDCDFGDLPDAGIAGLSPDYETTLADNGPYHYIIPMLSLGDDIDGETDATPDGMATGDDDDALPDDEDGITFFSTLNIVPGGTIKLPIDVINGTGTTAYLEGWIDWNGDGTLDPGEIIVDIDDSTTPFPAFITVAVPAVIADNVPIGVRFRLSHTPDMTPYGRAESGEVEDYLIQIDCATGTCIPMSSIIRRGAKD